MSSYTFIDLRGARLWSYEWALFFTIFITIVFTPQANLLKILMIYARKPLLRVTASFGENRLKICVLVYEFSAFRQADICTSSKFIELR